jgi:hypothetical protein
VCCEASIFATSRWQVADLVDHQQRWMGEHGQSTRQMTGRLCFLA